MRRRVVFGFLVPLGLALLTAFVVYRIIRTHNEDFRSVTATSRTSGQLNKLIGTVVDAETGQRGFAITGDETFLEPYYTSATEFGITLSELRRSLPDDASREALSEIDTLFERWHREVAEVVIGSRKGAPVDLDGALRGASTTFTGARAAELHYRLTGDAALLRRWGALINEAQRQLGRAQSLGLSGAQLTSVRAAAAQVNLYERAQSGPGRQSAPDADQGLDDTLFRLAAAAEVAEAKVTGIIKAGTGRRLIDGVRARVEELSSRVNGTLERNLAASDAAARRTQWVAFVGPLFAALVSLLAILQAQRRLGSSVRKLAAVAKGIAAGQLERRLNLAPNDELRPLAEDFNRMADRLSEREKQSVQFRQFSSTLQACVTTEEAYGVSERFGPPLFGGLSGTLYRVSDSRNLLETVARWGALSPADAPDASPDLLPAPSNPPVYTPSDCWALRQGRPLSVGDEEGVACAHAQVPAPAKSLCIPLSSQGETLAVLYLFTHDPGAELAGATEHFAVTVAEQLALALANLRLRESLKQQSIRDPLTGLFNRRHLEETLALELHRAARRAEPVSLVMFDVDHFKNYNDRFGHDAGDTVLRLISGLVQGHIRAGDVACRYGGEEFVLVQAGMSAAHALKRAEAMREAVAKLAPEHHGAALGTLTISLGVATYPEHARTADALIKRADEALYRAKHGGRNLTALAAQVQSA